MRSWLLLIPLLAIAGQTYAASTMRCEGGIVSLKDPAAEVTRKCGEPANRSFVGNLRHQSPSGTWNEVPVEEWIYGPSNGMYQYLRFVGARLDSIESRRN